MDGSLGVTWTDSIIQGVDIQLLSDAVDDEFIERCLAWVPGQAHEGIDNLRGDCKRRAMTDALSTLVGDSEVDYMMGVVKSLVTRTFKDWWGRSCPWDVRILASLPGEKALQEQGHHVDYAEFAQQGFWSCMVALQDHTQLCICTGKEVHYTECVL